MHWTGDKIRIERQARGLSQEQLARLLSEAQADNTTHVRTVTGWENGEYKPSGRNLAALDKVFAPRPTTGPTLTGATNLQLYMELGKRLGLLDALPDRDLRLPPPQDGQAGGEAGAGG